MSNIGTLLHKNTQSINTSPPPREKKRKKKSMATVKPTKSILKQPKTPAATSPPNDAANDKTDEETKTLAEAAALKKRHLDIAIKHALLIEHQRKTSDQVLKHIELLLDFPPSASPTPSASDATSFLRLVEIFQPSNFDELVEERRIDGRCAYPLCSNEPRGLRLKDTETWKLKKGAENWCCDACARKGLFVKAQLGEVPAWERVPGQQAPIVLHESDRHLVQGAEGADAEGDDARAKQQQQQQHVQQRVAERTELAMERGEKVASVRPDQVMTDFIVEKTLPVRPAQTASKVKFASATAIEGYEPKTDLGAGSVTMGDSLISDSISFPPVAEIADMLNVTQRTAAKKVEESDDESANEDEDDEDQQWKDMFENMKKRG